MYSRALIVDDQLFEMVKEFKFLGYAVTEDSNVTIKIKRVGKPDISWLVQLKI
jgi:hypothetical protein